MFSNCIRCGRELKDPWSAKEGIGPVCKRKVEAERLANALSGEELSEEEEEDIFDEMNRDYNKMISNSLKRGY